jgi:hypothetical protein
MGRPPIPKGWVIPMQRALQGHPESPRLWHQHIHDILLKDEGFECCTHEPCLSFKRDPETALGDDNHKVCMKKTPNDGFVLILCQVDDFAISGSSTEDLPRKEDTTNSKTSAPSIYFTRSETVHEQSADANERNLSRIGSCKKLRIPAQSGKIPLQTVRWS